MTSAVIPAGQISKLIPLREGELAQLTRAAIKGRALVVAFGHGGVALRPEQSPWAMPLLDEWRGLTFVDGAGI
jgi:hypothetical protein